MTPQLWSATVVSGLVIDVPAELRDACGTDAGLLCRSVFDATHSRRLASSVGIFLAAPLRILLIVVAALVVRALANRAITRLVAGTVRGSIPRVLRTRRGGVQPLVLELSPLFSERRIQRAETIGSVLRSCAGFVVYGIAFVMVLGELGFALAPIVASAGIVGVALGFGAQNLVKDFLSGIFMILEDQYGVGDVIDAGPASGTVEAVSLRTTQLRDVDGVVWHIRNGEIARIGNKSQGWSRAVLDVPVAHSASISLARDALKRAADELWRDPAWEDVILDEPEVWGVEDIQPDYFRIRLVIKTAPHKQWDVARAVRERVKTAFETDGIPMPSLPAAMWLRWGGDTAGGVGPGATAAVPGADPPVG